MKVVVYHQSMAGMVDELICILEMFSIPIPNHSIIFVNTLLKIK